MTRLAIDPTGLGLTPGDFGFFIIRTWNFFWFLCLERIAYLSWSAALARLTVGTRYSQLSHYLCAGGGIKYLRVFVLRRGPT